jgi:hypothetical protein|tara:strand:+ start:245 stop:496 length:252 start_codon:yes stop_codon:yes gene_type:complete
LPLTKNRRIKMDNKLIEATLIKIQQLLIIKNDELKELNNNFNILNLILVSSDVGVNLKTHTDYEINKNLLPKYKKILSDLKNV